MGRLWRRLLVAAFSLVLLTSTTAAQGIGGPYDRGYREGVQQAVEDNRERREPRFESSPLYRQADRGYRAGYGSRNGYRNDFRRGFAAGYRAEYSRLRDFAGQRRRDLGRQPRALRGFQEPAFARGYSDGWKKGIDDGRDRDRYDPVRHRDYREADDGYSRAYGPKDAYRNNYRAGFRQGYEDGYRDGARRRR